MARLLTSGGKAQVEQAVAIALRRLRIEGVPWEDPEAPPRGKAVASVRPCLTDDVAERMALAVLVPISRGDTLKLARRLWVQG
ncbi:MAG: hypothetical protein NZ742_04825 [Acidobacteria bacterium]|nr:hypothetical protein [Acidobacteriota bacterium]MDW7983590.1 hypothetical protein [Acidobacteriota bacterium]